MSSTDLRLILDIFARHAKTSEGQLQVELAQLEYQLPRLTGRGRAMSQLGGGIGTRGPGETQLETDRRKIHLRIDHIKNQLEAVRRIRHQQRQRREAGYRSLWLLSSATPTPARALSSMLLQKQACSNQLACSLLWTPNFGSCSFRPAARSCSLTPSASSATFPTPSLRAFALRSKRSTEQRSFSLYPGRFRSHRRRTKTQVERVLAELGASNKRVIHVLNKIDLVPPPERVHLSNDHEAVLVSSLHRTGLEQLLIAIDAALKADPLVEFTFRLPQSEGSILASLEGGALIDEKRFEGNLVFLRARGPASLLDRYHRFREKLDRSDERSGAD